MPRKVIHFLFILQFFLFQLDKFVNGNLCVSTVQQELKSSSENFVKSYVHFQQNIYDFFEYPFKRIERDRLKLKNALTKFWEHLTAPDSTTTETTKILSNTKVKSSDQPLDHILDTEDLIKLHGFKAEAHKVKTRDGYRLTIFRVLEVDNDDTQLATKIALFYHGLLGSSSDWVLLGPDKALPYMLIKSGYEVWLANARGNEYSRKHKVLSVESTEFWNFTFHEIGCYDLPATFDYIQIVSGSGSKIDFIGHSMGATALLVLLTSVPQYNHVLNSAILMAPLAIMQHVTGPLNLLAEFMFKHGTNSLNFLGHGMFLSKGVLPSTIINKYCVGDTVLCSNPWLLMANGGIDVNPFIKTNIMNHVPSGTSQKTIIHYAQLIISGKFEKFYTKPYHERETHRDTTITQEYPLEKIDIPMTLFSSINDWLAPSADVTNLMNKIPNCVAHYIVRRSNFTHTDFVWSDDVHAMVYSIVLSILNY